MLGVPTSRRPETRLASLAAWKEMIFAALPNDEVEAGGGDGKQSTSAKPKR